MGFVTDAFKSPPKVSKEPVVETQDAKRKAKKSRTALISTAGGIGGQELSSGQVQPRNTLFGN